MCGGGGVEVWWPTVVKDCCWKEAINVEADNDGDEMAAVDLSADEGLVLLAEDDGGVVCCLGDAVSLAVAVGDGNAPLKRRDERSTVR